MKSFFQPYLFITFLFFFSTSMTIFIKSQITVPGLVAYYPFNGSAEDASTNKKHGIDCGLQGYTQGISSMSRLFLNDQSEENISNDYVLLPNVINPKEFTINLWVKFNNSGNHQTLIFLSSFADWTKANFMLATSGDLKLQVIFNGLDLRTMNYTHQSLLNGQFNNSFLNSKPLELYIFYNITCIFKNSELTLYLDGSEYAKYYHIDRGVGRTGSPILVGVCPKPGEFYYPLMGQIDELRFYNRAISENEVRQLSATK